MEYKLIDSLYDELRLEMDKLTYQAKTLSSYPIIDDTHQCWAAIYLSVADILPTEEEKYEPSYYKIIKNKGQYFISALDWNYCEAWDDDDDYGILIDRIPEFDLLLRHTSAILLKVDGIDE